MSLAPESDLRSLLRHELEVLHGNWGWYLALGIALIVTGTLAISSAFIATILSVTFLSVLLIIAGATEILGAFWARRWSGFFALLLIGILYLAAGVLALGRPIQAAEALTLLIAAMLIVGGVFRIIAAVAIRFPSWPWLLLNGVITLLLGILIWRQWPGSGLWVIGLFVGIEMIFNGWTWVMLALAVRRLPRGVA
jgi:uncharacterized membrane protein HdeD (DUF308 family)